MGNRILAVDDERHILRLIEVNLRAAGYDVVCAADGVQALAAVATDPPDLILLDWAMPELDGLEVLKRLKANPVTAGIPVIMLTAKAQDSDVLKGWESGVDAYLTKPFNPRELLAFVGRLISEDMTEEEELGEELL